LNFLSTPVQVDTAVFERTVVASYSDVSTPDCNCETGVREDYFQCQPVEKDDVCDQGDRKPDPAAVGVQCTCDNVVVDEEWGTCTCKKDETTGDIVCEHFKTQTCNTDPNGPFLDDTTGDDCTTNEDKTQTLSEICIPLDPYTEWTQWTACFPECTAPNSVEQPTKTRTRECKPDFIAINDARCDKENDSNSFEETENCAPNVCQVCENFADNAFCAERPNTICVNEEENGVKKATCQCKSPYALNANGDCLKCNALRPFSWQCTENENAGTKTTLALTLTTLLMTLYLI